VKDPDSGLTRSDRDFQATGAGTRARRSGGWWLDGAKKKEQNKPVKEKPSLPPANSGDMIMPSKMPNSEVVGGVEGSLYVSTASHSSVEETKRPRRR